MPRKHLNASWKRSTIAIAVGLAGLAAAQQASAFIAYQDSSNKLTIGGSFRYGLEFNHNGGGKTNFFDGGTRTNIVYQHTFSNDWTVLGRYEEEWDPLFTTHNGDNHSNNYRYIAVTNPKWGTFSVGKQDSLMYDFVDVWTDQPWWYADYTETAYSGNTINGLVERQPSTLKYVNKVGRFTLGAMYGWSNGRIKDTYALSNGDSGYITGTNPYGLKRKYFAELGAQYDAGHHVTIGTAMHRAHMEAANGEGNLRKPNVFAWNLGVNWTPGNWFLSGVGGYSKNADLGTSLEGHSFNHYGAFAGYTFPGLLGRFGDLQAYYDFNYQQEHGDSSMKVERNIIGVASMSFHDSVIVALEHMFINDGSGNYESLTGNHDSTTLFVRYNY